LDDFEFAGELWKLVCRRRPADLKKPGDEDDDADDDAGDDGEEFKGFEDDARDDEYTDSWLPLMKEHRLWKGDEDLKQAQYEVVGALFSFGKIDYKLTVAPTGWAVSGSLGIVFLNEMFLESWVQIVLQIINNHLADSWGVIEGLSLTASIGMFVFNIALFSWKFGQTRKTFGLAGAFLNTIKTETLEEWANEKEADAKEANRKERRRSQRRSQKRDKRVQGDAPKGVLAGTSAALQAFSPAEPERADDPATDDEFDEDFEDNEFDEDPKDNYVDIAPRADDPNAHESFDSFEDEDGDNNGQETY